MHPPSLPEITPCILWKSLVFHFTGFHNKTFNFRYNCLLRPAWLVIVSNYTENWNYADIQYKSRAAGKWVQLDNTFFQWFQMTCSSFLNLTTWILKIASMKNYEHINVYFSITLYTTFFIRVNNFLCLDIMKLLYAPLSFIRPNFRYMT